MTPKAAKQLTQADLYKIREIQAKKYQLKLAKMEVRRIKTEIEEMERDNIKS